MTSQFDLPEPVFAVVKKAKGVARLAKILGIRPGSVYGWTRVPEHHLDVIHRELGIHPMELRPDCFDPERLRKKAEFRPDNKSIGPRRRRYKYKKVKISKADADMSWLRDDPPLPAFTPRGRRL